MDRILAAAEIIANARRKRTRLASLPADTIPQDEDEAYRVQRAVHDLLLPQTGAMAGYKIGCTSAVMQEYLDISHPCSGGVFENGIHDSGVPAGIRLRPCRRRMRDRGAAGAQSVAG